MQSHAGDARLDGDNGPAESGVGDFEEHGEIHHAGGLCCYPPNGGQRRDGREEVTHCSGSAKLGLMRSVAERG